MARPMKTCSKCNNTLPLQHFPEVDDFLFPGGYAPICFNCLGNEIKENEGSFEIVDRICQWLGIPFIADKWIEVEGAFDTSAIEIYLKMYKDNAFPYINWKECFKRYKELEADGLLEENIVQMSAGELNKLRAKWRQEYTEPEELKYLEKLFQGTLNTYSIFGDTQLDQVKKICKISLIIDQKIRAGEDFDKYIKSYDQLCKMANLVPKNIKDATDFSSVGELFAYLEKSGWMNEFYNGVENDIVDKTIKDIQNWSRNLYINESSIPEDIANRIEALKIANDMEDEMNRVEDDGIDDSMLEDLEDEEFEADVG